MSSRIGLCSSRARVNAASPHGSQCTGWCAADCRYADGSAVSALAMSGAQEREGRADEQLRADDQRFLVDVEGRAVVRRRRAALRRRADEGEAARNALEKECHVLAA